MISNMKRTTLILQDRRLMELKRLAADRGQTLSAVVDEFLADGLRRSSAPKWPLTPHGSGAITVPPSGVTQRSQR